ncbi:response regulator [Magnetospira sp. QH-2]|uniref:response regulator n=1 Tax=Magnetospira sp. (strain QH-2) TaxID=1288970 RepID=UPI0003E81514|nr:response regulator [Magnetospira sp. QH-2]CCQ74320.1 Protein of unknown function [Magnetospira sp. QH-2]
MPKILIIDDDEVDRESLRRALESVDWEDLEIREETNGTAGLEALANNDFDCALLDYRLPEIDGLAVLELLAARPDREFCPIIMMTGQGNEDTAVAAMKLGATDYLVKTSRQVAYRLIASVKKILERQDLIRDRERAERELVEAREAAKADEAKLKLLGKVLDRSGFSVVVTDSDLHISYVNRAFTLSSGHGEASCLGRSLDLFILMYDDAAFRETIWSAVAKTGKWQGEIWMKKQNGETVPAHLEVASIIDDATNSMNYVCQFRTSLGLNYF